MAKANGKEIIAEVKAKKQELKEAAQHERTEKIKEQAHNIYISFLKFGVEVVEATFAFIGVTTFIHTSFEIQTVIAVVFVALILIVKFNIKK